MGFGNVGLQTGSVYTMELAPWGGGELLVGGMLQHHGGASGLDGARGIATPADASLMMQLGAESVFVGSGIFKSDDPDSRANAIVKATTHYQDATRVAEASAGLKKAMKGLDMSEIPEEERLQERGW